MITENSEIIKKEVVPLLSDLTNAYEILADSQHMTKIV